MADLIEKFFREDLTEAEEQALGETLSSSEDAPERFVGLAEAAYTRFGLPEPVWEGPDHLPPFPKAGMKLWQLFLMGGLVAGLAYWAWSSRGGAEAQAPLAPASDHSMGTKPKGALARPAPQVARGADPSGEEEEEESLPPSKEEAAGTTSAPINKAPQKGASGVPEPKSLLTPINMGEDPTRKFSNISVKINQAQTGKVKVRVLDMAGLEVTPLYSGNLGPGQWVFDWDGKLGDGKMVSPGIYQIEVRSGSFKGKKNIRIQ